MTNAPEISETNCHHLTHEEDTYILYTYPPPDQQMPATLSKSPITQSLCGSWGARSRSSSTSNSRSTRDVRTSSMQLGFARTFLQLFRRSNDQEEDSLGAMILSRRRSRQEGGMNWQTTRTTYFYEHLLHHTRTII